MILRLSSRRTDYEKHNTYDEKEFQRYALQRYKQPSMHRYQSIVSDYISPTIIEEHQLNVANGRILASLMMDRIIF